MPKKALCWCLVCVVHEMYAWGTSYHVLGACPIPLLPPLIPLLPISLLPISRARLFSIVMFRV